MTIKRKLKKAVSDAVRTVVELARNETRPAERVDSAVEIFLVDALRHARETEAIEDPVAFVDFLRSCVEPLSAKIVTTKESDAASDLAGRRFLSLLRVLQTDIPRIPFSSAFDMALTADRHRRTRMPINLERWSTDSGFTFEIAASLGQKGRVVASVVRLCRPERCLELGTAHGMSAMFIMETLKQLGPSGHLTTIEGLERMFSIASRDLTARYGDQVQCLQGMTGDLLPKLAGTIGPIDFLFHDAAHSGDAYIADFNAIVATLAPGAAVLFDDIRWRNPDYPAPTADPYSGWAEVVAHPRIRHAAEIDDAMGLALLR